jgi:hypothetical protein
MEWLAYIGLGVMAVAVISYFGFLFYEELIKEQK